MVVAKDTGGSIGAAVDDAAHHLAATCAAVTRVEQLGSRTRVSWQLACLLDDAVVARLTRKSSSDRRLVIGTARAALRIDAALTSP